MFQIILINLYTITSLRLWGFKCYLEQSTTNVLYFVTYQSDALNRNAFVNMSD